ncbi:hypothetical protein HY310_00650 [Candidatus Microgenomates bacterium]|nr:hypothetical protein [Candidatus Microgenomates bacterium]
MDVNNSEKIVFQPTVPLTKEEVINKHTPPNYLLWFLIGGVAIMFFVVVVLVVIGFSIIGNTTKNLAAKPPEEASVVEQPLTTITFKSKFASDAGVLKIKEDLVKLQTDITAIDILEPQLTPPNIDLNISIQSTN